MDNEPEEGPDERIEYKPSATGRNRVVYEEEEETESLFESFASFFETVQGRSMNEAEQEAAQDAWNEIIEGGAE